MEQVVAWDCLIKWGIEQTPGLGSENSDRTKWPNVMSPADFFDKVQPYKKIIPDHIYEKIGFHTSLRTTTLQSRRGKYESNIIKPKLINIITNWIDSKDFHTMNDSTYNFKLIYRDRRDGINNESFKDKCNGQVASLVLIKVQQSDKILVDIVLLRLLKNVHKDNGFNFGQDSLSMNHQCLKVNNRKGNYEKNLNTDTVYTIKKLRLLS
ncbi:hypothetical protein C1645_840616 [Glomus cerebriforme]|uniref:TLDc domain-containing protein n=1 Tax=Glomus cerebriforme TaxID=658196 RepID=A0A397S1T4_9GLOM|nr:hypothetical protein C1645_840616 [Glomus cerebriforme]